MNLFTGMTNPQIASACLMLGLFTFYAMLVAASLGAFYVSSRPVRGRPRTASAWHLLATVLFMIAIVSTVWAAPAEKAFTENGQMWTGDRFTKVIVGVAFTVAGLLVMAIGALAARAQKREAARQAIVAG